MKIRIVALTKRKFPDVGALAWWAVGSFTIRAETGERALHLARIAFEEDGEVDWTHPEFAEPTAREIGLSDGEEQVLVGSWGLED